MANRLLNTLPRSVLGQQGGQNQLQQQYVPPGQYDPVNALITGGMNNLFNKGQASEAYFNRQPGSEGIYNEPPYEMALGEIQADMPKSAINAIRKIMAGENKLRGARSGELIDDLARGVWLHGRSTYPETGKTFAESRFRTGNLGEPAGMSLTANKDLLKTSFAKTWADESGGGIKLTPTELAEYKWAFNKYEEAVKAGHVKTKNALIKKMENLLGANFFVPPSNIEMVESGSTKFPEFGRTFPKFGGVPSEKILPAWKAPETEWAQEILRDAYTKAASKVIPTASKSLVRNHLKKNPDQVKDYVRKELEKRSDEFNQEISNILQEKGYKALLYSPNRYNEYEMRMLNPDDVMMLDMRTQESPGLERLYSGPEEYFMNHIPDNHNPNVKLGSQKKRLKKWEQKTADAPASLRHIYKDIDLTRLFE